MYHYKVTRSIQPATKYTASNVTAVSLHSWSVFIVQHAAWWTWTNYAGQM